jgi:hypothetical protein
MVRRASISERVLSTSSEYFHVTQSWVLAVSLTGLSALPLFSWLPLGGLRACPCPSSRLHRTMSCAESSRSCYTVGMNRHQQTIAVCLSLLAIAISTASIIITVYTH